MFTYILVQISTPTLGIFYNAFRVFIFFVLCFLLLDIFAWLNERTGWTRSRRQEISGGNASIAYWKKSGRDDMARMKVRLGNVLRGWPKTQFSWHAHVWPLAALSAVDETELGAGACLYRKTSVVAKSQQITERERERERMEGLNAIHKNTIILTSNRSGICTDKKKSGGIQKGKI